MADDLFAPSRRLLLGAVAGAAGLAHAATVPPIAASRPRQGWAHRDGKISLRRNAPPVAAPFDMLMIHEAFGRYGMAHDEGQAEVFASLFADDALVEVADGSGTPFQSVRGRPAVVANYQNVFAQQHDQRRHCFTNILVERIDGGSAAALAYATVVVAADGLSLGASVIYSATLVRGDDGAWRFAYLFIGMDAYTTAKPKV